MSRSSSASSVGPAVLLASGVLFAHAGSLGAPFIFDDHAAITLNASIRDLSRLGEVLLPPPDGSGAAGRPIVNLSLAVNYALGGENPVGYHAFNVLLHLANTLLVFTICGRTLQRGLHWSPARPLACLIALVWAIHPLQTESVTCIIQRTELLAGFFLLYSIYAFDRGALGADRRWLAASVAACALGMATKEIMVSAPLLIAFYDRAFVSGSFAELWRRRRAYYLGLASSWVALLALVWHGGGTRGAAAGFGLGIGVWEYLLTQCRALVLYVRLVLWPTPLVLDYGTATVSSALEVLPQGMLVCAALVGAAYAIVKRPALGFLALWFFAILAPSSSVVPLVEQTIAEHRMYLPLGAVALSVILALFHGLGRRCLSPIVFSAVALALLSHARNRILRDELLTWADTVAKIPENPRAQASYATALLQRGHTDEALAAFSTALRLDPNATATHLNIGNVLYQLRRFEAAANHYRRAIELSPASPAGYNSLGAALVELGDGSGALREFDRALTLDPVHEAALLNRGRALLAAGRSDDAVDNYERALRVRPDNPDVHYNLGLALARLNRLPEARRHFASALELRPDPRAYLNYARFLAAHGAHSDAIASLETALKLNPMLHDARRELERLRAEVRTP